MVSNNEKKKNLIGCRIRNCYWPKSLKEKKLEQKRKQNSQSGNRTPVSRVTGGDTYHYTNEKMYCTMVSAIYLK